MVEIKLYSNKGYSTEYLKDKITNTLADKGLKIHLNEVSDPNLFFGIEKIPVIEHKGEIFQNSSLNLNDYAKEVTSWIIRRETISTFEKIIVPIDYSDCSKNALAYALEFGDHFKSSEVKLVHVFKPHADVALKTSADLPLLIVGSQSEFEAYNERIAKQKQFLFKLKKDFLVGFPGDEILKLSQEDTNALIVMGTTGKNLSIKSWLGSVSTRISKSGSSPTLIVPPESKFKKYKSILVCVTDQPDSKLFIKNIASLLDKKDGILHLFNYNNPLFNSESKLNEWSKYFKIENIKLHAADDSDFTESINKYLSTSKIDLISLNRSHRSMISQMFQPSKTKKLAMTTKIPFLIFHNE